MSKHLRGLFRMVLVFLLGSILCPHPLFAQLDPRLQGSKTDFMDLYQASTSLKAKPEIVTVFDFSGSMAALMYHPLFVNQDASDSSSKNNMRFSLDPGNSSYTVTAWPRDADRNYYYSTYSLTVGGSGAAQAPHTGGTRWEMGPISSSTSSFVGGTSVTFSATVIKVRSGYTNRVNWEIVRDSDGAVVATGSSSSPSSFTWTVPALVAGPFVEASLQGGVVGNLTSRKLIKPNGQIVTAADAASASSTSGLYGASYGAQDVRNWVRAASHVRFEYTDGSTLRTIDIPIPWKITNENSSGNPLSSWRMPDPVFTRTTVVNAVPTTTTYGSGTDVEMDLCYTLEHGSHVLTGDGSKQTNTTLWTTRTGYVGTYRTDYVDWLFRGKYQGTNPTLPNYTTNSSFVGKYIAYDAENATLVPNQADAGWGRGYGSMGATERVKIPIYALDGITYLGDSWTTGQEPSPNPKFLTEDPPAKDMRIPALTRAQAVKRAAIQTWINFQADVFWAYRFLDVGDTGSTPSNNSRTTLNANDPSVTVMDGRDSGWTLLNKNSVSGMKRIASLFAYNGTPLTYATSRALAQFTDPESVFNEVETGLDAPSQCGNHFLIVFTDGVDNGGSPTSATPYIVTGSGTTKVNAAAGNKVILQNPAAIDSTYWNMFTYAGIAAHMADSSLGSLNIDYKPAFDPGSSPVSRSRSDFIPYAIKKRGSVDFQSDHRITTMAVGVSLGGRYTEAGAKRNLFLTAAVGDAGMPTTEDLSTLTPFVWEPDPVDPEAGRKRPGSLYFFDANSPEKLNTDLRYAIKSATGTSSINATANPNLPFIGASLGKQVYVGKFTPPKTGGAVWPGDLLMFGTREVNGETQIIDKSGAEATVLDATTAQWSAAEALLNARKWNARNLYTRIPKGTALVKFTDEGLSYSDDTTGLKNFVASGTTTVGSAAQKAVIQFAAGGDTVKGPFDADGRPMVNRTNIMGDIINSAPVALEFNWNDVKDKLPARLQLEGGNRFRLILVGTNQGWLHAFGEVVKAENVVVDNTDTPIIVKGVVDELWSFMPTDFLGNLGYITVPNNPHRFMVDGTAAIYHLDLPPAGGGGGNGIMDSSTDSKERAIAIFGLRKGGRSYYALDLFNPFTPTLKWSVVPDEADADSFFSKLGFSTCTPGIGRIVVGDKIKDAVFLGGGYSNPEIEAYFKDSSGAATPLGRSVLALDVNTGALIASVDMTSNNIGGTRVGPVSAGVIPFEFILNSAMAQRAYFTDYNGGLWSWGSKAVASVAPYVDFRMDTSRIDDWLMRKVYQDANLSTALGARYTTLPAPFRVGYFPGAGKPGSAIPAAVGIAMVSGDRNNPVDEKYNTTDKSPIAHRLTVVFDRQDSRAWGLDTAAGPDAGITSEGSGGPGTGGQLVNFTNNKATASDVASCSNSIFKYITPGCPDYYLSPYTPGTDGNPSTPKTPQFGYYINFVDTVTTDKFVPKGINSPMVVANSLFYTYFNPTKADVCKGGAGDSYSWFTGDVVNPLVSDARPGLRAFSGLKDTWAGVASDYIAVGTRGVLQGGAVAVSNPAPGASPTTPEIHNTSGMSSPRFPKPRVWRTVQNVN